MWSQHQLIWLAKVASHAGNERPTGFDLEAQSISGDQGGGTPSSNRRLIKTSAGREIANALPVPPPLSPGPKFDLMSGWSFLTSPFFGRSTGSSNTSLMTSRGVRTAAPPQVANLANLNPTTICNRQCRQSW